MTCYVKTSDRLEDNLEIERSGTGEGEVVRVDYRGEVKKKAKYDSESLFNALRELVS